MRKKCCGTKWSTLKTSTVLLQLNGYEGIERWNKVICYSTAFDLLSQLSKPTQKIILTLKNDLFYFKDIIMSILETSISQEFPSKDRELLHALACDLYHGEYSKFINEVE